MSGILDKLYENQANTDQRSEDPRLRGRTYSIPFEDVWQAVLSVGSGGLLGWSVGRSDDQSGVVDALAKTPLIGSETDVHIHVGLDHLGQTRVDLVAVSRSTRGDLGRSKRLIRRFTERLDRQLDARPGQIIDPTRHPVYRETA